MTLKFEGYVKSPDGFGTGTYEVLHPKGASIEITRSLFEGDVLQITSVRNTPDLALEKARGIRLYDGNKKLFDGYCAHLITDAAATNIGRCPLVFTIGERNLRQYISQNQQAALKAMSIDP